MTEKEILKIKEHIEIHARREPGAVKITEIMWKAVDELEQIADLERENAELKETLKTYNGCGDWDNDFHTCRVYLQHEELQMYVEQLTKARELIKNIIRVTWGEGWNYSLEWKVKAEQFLSEVEK